MWNIPAEYISKIQKTQSNKQEMLINIIQTLIRWRKQVTKVEK